MYSANFVKNKSNLSKQYLVNEILEATPQQIILKIYDFAIVNCQRQDLIKTNNALQELINALSFEGDEVKKISLGLLKLYQFCQEQMRQKNYDLVVKILSELRDTWTSIFNQT
jgi:flagellar secretion chaperone FliS